MADVEAASTGCRTWVSHGYTVQITSGGLHQFFDISPDALVVVNQAGTFVMANKQAEANRLKDEFLAGRGTS